VVLPLDVDNSGFVSLADLLPVVADLREHGGPRELTEPRPSDAALPFVDVNGDQFVSVSDLIDVVTDLRAGIGQTALAIAAALANDTAPEGVNSDGLTNDASLRGAILENFSEGARILAQIDDGAFQRVAISSSGEFLWDPNLARNGSADGEHVVRLVAQNFGGAVTTSEVRLTFDSQAPAASLARPAALDDQTLEIQLNEPIGPALFDAGNYLLSFKPAGGFSIPNVVNSVVQVNDRTARLNLGAPLSEGAYTLHFAALMADAAGNVAGGGRVAFELIIPVGIESFSPAHGEDHVNVARETIVRFNDKIDPATLTGEALQLTAAGKAIGGRIVVSSTERFATFFYDEPLPASTEVQATLDGNRVKGRDGYSIDADGDGLPGGVFTAKFRTLPLTRIPGTKVWGFLKDAYTGEPIVGATIRVDGFPEANAVTDATGRYDLIDMPAPTFFVHIDGSTATSAPPGRAYPVVGKPFPSIPGQTMQMGMNGVPMDLFLPTMAMTDITPLSTTEPTDVGFGAQGLAQLQAMFPDVDPSVWQRTHVTIAPAGATDDDGNAATEALIIPVPPDRLPGPLPPGVDPSLVISIQPLGATNFDPPAPVVFPNLEGLAPGEKSLIFSFNHDAGRWDVAGAGTVSADGLMIHSDPGVGILAPGWHLTQPGTSNRTRARMPLLVPRPGTPTEPKESNACVAGVTGLIFDTIGFLDGVRQFGSPLLSGLVGGLAGLAGGGPIGAIGGFIAGFWTAEKTSEQLNVVKEAIKGAAESIVRGIAENKGVGEIVLDVAKDWTKLVALGVLEGSLNPFDKFKLMALQVIERGHKLGQDKAKLERCFANLNPFGEGEGESDLADAYNRMAMEFGWDPPTPQQIEDFADLYAQLTENKSVMPRAIQTLMSVAEAVGAVSALLETPNPTEQTIQALQERLEFLNSQFDFLSDYPAALENSILEIQNEHDALIGRATQTPSDSRIHYSYALDNGVEIRGLATGGVVSGVLPPNATARLTLLDAGTGFTAGATFETGASGTATENELILLPSQAPDTDGDGLHDDAEAVVGTATDLVDTDNDGLSDLAEVQQGLDPLGGRNFPTGIVSTLPLPGEARGIAVEGSILDGQSQTAYVATGSHGLAIVDVSQFDTPILQGQLDLSGDSQDVAADARLGIAAVAAGSAGLHLIDVSDAATPQLLRTVNAQATQVDAFDGVAYAATENQLVSVDLFTGEVLQRFALPGAGAVTGLAREADRLYGYRIGSGTFFVLQVEAGNIQLLGQLGVAPPANVSRLGVAAGNGVAYLIGGGLRTVDVSDPTKPVLLADAQANFTAHGLALNGSAIALTVADVLGVGLLDVSDPTDTDAAITTFDTPGSASAVAIGLGIAFVADGRGGLQVLNYLPFDGQRQPPQVTIDAGALDADPDAPGVQVIQGDSIPLRVAVTDDVQVRNVEYLVNGAVVRNDVSFPFDFAVVAAGSAGASLTIQVRATDTGGNQAVSDPLVVNLVPDTVAPQIVQITPANGAQTAHGVRRVMVQFNEPLAGSTVTAANFTLRNGQGEVVAPIDVQLRAGDRTVQLGYDPLPGGDYSLTINAAAVTDRAGNPLDAAPVVSSFHLEQIENFWIGAAEGRWHEPANWSTGAVPGPMDDVYIGGETSVTVTVDDDAAVRSITLGGEAGQQTLKTNVHVDFAVARSIQVNSTGQLRLSSLSLPADAEIRGSGEVVFEGELTIEGRFAAENVEMKNHTTFNGVIGPELRNVRIPGGSFVDVKDQLLALDTLLIADGGRLLSSGEIEIADSFVLAGRGGLGFSIGSIIGRGTTRILPGATMRINGATALAGERTLENFGAVVIEAGGISVEGGSRIVNRPGATFDFAQDGNIGGGSGPNFFENEGLVRKIGGVGKSTINSEMEFYNRGRVEAQSGTLALAGGGTQTGEFHAAASASIEFSGFGASGRLPGHQLHDGTEFSGAGSFRFTGGTNLVTSPLDVEGTVGVTAGLLQVDAPVETAGLMIGGGSLAGSGDVDVSKQFTWTFGAMRGAGTTRLLAGATGAWSNGLTLLEGRKFENFGAIVFNAAPPSSLGFGDAARFINHAGAMLDVGMSVGFYGSGAQPNVLENEGLLRKISGPGRSVFDAALQVHNRGMIEALTGSLALEGGGVHAGAFRAAEAATIEFAALGVGGLLSGHNFETATKFEGAGTLRFNSGANTIAAALDVPGTLLVRGGVTTVTTDVKIASLTIEGGTLAGAGLVEVLDTFTWTGGAMSGSGVTRLASGATGAWSDRITLDQGRTAENFGMITFGSAFGQLNVNNGSRIVNRAGATFEVILDADLAGAGTQPNVFENEGLLRKASGAGRTALNNELRLNNRGTVESVSGVFGFDGGGTHSGDFQAAVGARVEFSAFGGGGRAAGHTFDGGSIGGPGDVYFLGGVNRLAADLPLTGELRLTGGTLHAQGDVHLAGAYVQNGGKLRLELRGPTVGVDFDRLTIAGQASLGGTLEIAFTDGFTPVVGSSFDVLVFGSFANPFTTVVFVGQPAATHGETEYLSTFVRVHVIAN
jgi:hypothetical protein